MAALRLPRILTRISPSHKSLFSASSPTLHRLYLSSTPSQSPNPNFPFQSRAFTSSRTLLIVRGNCRYNYLFHGCDYYHWLIRMVDLPQDPKPSFNQKLSTYIETAAKVVGSVEEAKRIIYSCGTTYYGFQVRLPEEKAAEFKRLPEVLFVLPDFYRQNGRYPGDNHVIANMSRPSGNYGDPNREFNQMSGPHQSTVSGQRQGGTYIYNMKNQISDKDKLADKLESEEKEKMDAAVKEALEWLDDNQSAEKEDYDEKLKEVEAVCNPIITAVYQRSGGAPGEGGGDGAEDDEHDEL